MLLIFRLEYKTSVICHTVNTQKAKNARRDRPLVLASNRCETFENLQHIDAPVRTSFRDFKLTKLNDDFYQYQEPSINIYSLFVAEQDTARDSIYTFNTGKCVILAEPYTIDSSFSSCVFLLNLLPVV